MNLAQEFINFKMKLFGTDGIRGVVGGSTISALSVLKIGFAYGKFLKTRFKSKTNPKIIIGKDTRISGYMLESALESGLLASGVDIILAGPLPTPAISHLVLSLRLKVAWLFLQVIIFMKIMDSNFLMNLVIN